MKKCKKEKENINKTTCKDCEYVGNCENVTKKGEIKMKNNEKRILDTVDESVYFCLQKGIDKGQIAEWLDDVISGLPENSSSELFNILYRIQDNLLYGYEF